MPSYDDDQGGPVVNPTTWALEELDTLGFASTVEPVAESPEDRHRHEVEEAFERGRAEGLREGEARAQARLTSALQALETATTGLTAESLSWREALARNLHALAVAVARQIVQRELRTDPEQLEQIVSRALSHFQMEEAVTVRLNPADLSLLSTHAVEIQSTGASSGSLAGGREIRWRADANVERGGCVVEGAERLVDGRVDTALLRIYQGLGDA
ncbi:MAG: FliH/SctL family protein [Gemmatimonadota bacterium]|nr:hypothetical protein [Gemmatimonadota bacterium]